MYVRVCVSCTAFSLRLRLRSFICACAFRSVRSDACVRTYYVLYSVLRFEGVVFYLNIHEVLRLLGQLSVACHMSFGLRFISYVSYVLWRAVQQALKFPIAICNRLLPSFNSKFELVNFS
jgi:hypothetical protein